MSLRHPLFNELAMQEMARMIEPNVTVLERVDCMELYAGEKLLGSVVLELAKQPESWFVTIHRSSMLAKQWPEIQPNTTHGPFRSLSTALRRLLGADNGADVIVDTGICGDDQQSSFCNATLQSAGQDVEFSIATKLDIPAAVLAGGDAAVGKYIKITLKRASMTVPGLSFKAQVGAASGISDAD